MGRYEPPNIFFFAPTNLNTALESGATRPLETLTVTSRLGGIGEFECTYPYPQAITGAYIPFGALEAIGNVVIFTYVDERYPSGAGRIRAFGDCYRIESAVVEDRAEGGPVVRLRGRSLIAELEDKQAWTPIGTETTHNTTILTGKPIPAPSTTTAAGSYVAGSTEITLTDGSAFVEGDMVLLPLSGGGTLITTVSGKDEDTPNVITIASPLPGTVSNGATITRRARRVYPTSADGFEIGAKIVITLNGGGTHTTLIESGPETDEDENTYYYVRDGITAAANAGNALSASNTSKPTTTDISAILANAPGWTSTLSGIGSGSSHVPEGATVYELLEAVAEIHSSTFRQDYDSAGRKPLRRIKWGISNSGSGGKISLMNPPRADLPSFEASTNRGVIAGSISREWKWNVVTRVYPTGGDPGVSLYGVSTSTRSILSGMGLTIVDNPAVLGLYEEPYVYNATLEPTQIVGKAVTFGDVVPETVGPSSSLNACDVLALRCADYLTSRDRSYWEWRITDVEIASAVVLEVGQYVDLTRYLDAQVVKSTYNYETVPDLVTREVTLRWDRSKGYPSFDLVLSDAIADPLDGGRSLAQQFRTYNRMIRRAALGGDNRSIVTYVGTSGSSSPHTHGEYLPRSGGQMTGNITFSGAQTVDGVDISAHAANPSAHHAPVTAGNTSIDIPTGQVIQVATDAARGITTGASGVGLNISATGGLQFNGSNQLEVELPTNSGLTRDGTGLYLSPSTLTATTTNAVSGSGHTHAITATDNGNTTPAALLKTSVTGALTLAALGVGATTTTSATIFAQSKDQDDYTLHLKQLAGQTADVWRVENSSGSALIRLTGGGDLESGLPGFVSGHTGWQITATGDAEFNNARIRGELHATTFVADEMHAVGGMVLIKTASIVSNPVGGSDNVLPAINGSFTLRAQASWDTGLNYFPVGSILRLKPMGEIASGGSLDLYDISLEVTAVGSISGRQLSEGEPGAYPLTCVRRLGGETGFVIPSGTAIVKWTETGASGYTGAVMLYGDGGSTAPYIDVFTINKIASGSWGGVPPSTTPRVRVGNLRGVLGKSADEWGIAAGYDLSDTNATTQRYIVASDLGVELRNVNLKLYNGSSPTVDISRTGVVKFGIDTGSDATTAFVFNSATGGLRVGPQVAGKPNLYWDGTSLYLRQHTTPVITLDGSNGSAYFSGVVNIGSSGGIYQGTGTFGSPTTGLKMWNDGGIGRLATYNGGTVQVALDTSGKLLAGASNVVADADGLVLRPYTTSGSGYFDASSNIASLRWKTPAGTVAGYMFARYDSSNGHRSMWMASGNRYVIVNNDTGIEINAPTVALGRSGAADTIYIYGDIVQTQGQATLDFTGKHINPAGVVAGYDVTAGSSLLAGDYVKGNTGLVAGAAFIPTVSAGQIGSDLSGASYRAVVLTDSTNIAHGMTGIVATYQYGGIGKANSTTGGIEVVGLSEDIVGIHLEGYATNAQTGSGTTGYGNILLDAYLKSGTGGGSYGDNANLFVVRNNGSARLILKGDGDLLIDGAQSSYDDYDDVALLRTADLILAGREIDGAFAEWTQYNREDLVRLGLISEGGFVNITRMQRLLTGAIWQLHKRMAALEG